MFGRRIKKGGRKIDGYQPKGSVDSLSCEPPQGGSGAEKIVYGKEPKITNEHIAALKTMHWLNLQQYSPDEKIYPSVIMHRFEAYLEELEGKNKKEGGWRA